MQGDLLGVAPWAVITAAVTWSAQLLVYRNKRATQAATAQHESDDRLIIHRDELTFSLLQNARLEMDSARIEVDSLRDENRKLRSMESHFFFFQQSLDHLEAMLRADTAETRATAERAARAFLNRMRRLQEAKGTLANEVQRASSEAEIRGRAKSDGGK